MKKSAYSSVIVAGALGLVACGGGNQQFGTPGSDSIFASDVSPSGDLYVAGKADGDLGGPNNVGTGKAYVRKFSAAGDVAWTRQFEAFNVEDVELAPNGDLLVGGATETSLSGQPYGGDTDGYLRRYDASGTELWTRQFDGTGFDLVRGVAADADGNAYAAGSLNYQGVLRKYDPSGTLVWSRMLTGSATCVVTDTTGNVYVGAYSAADAYALKYSPAGALLWSRTFTGTGSTTAVWGAAVDSSGALYLAGYSDGAVEDGGGHLGLHDAFVRKYDTAGNPQWTRQFGTSAEDYASDIEMDADGNAVVVGTTYATLPGQTAAGGGRDVYARRYAPSGAEVGTVQTGTSSLDWGSSVSVDGNDVYICGSTGGAIDGFASAGGGDAAVFLVDP